jgi:hypothetical protein
VRRVLLLTLAVTLTACDDLGPASCLCIRPPPLQIVGHLSLTNVPLGGIPITVAAFRTQCGQGADLGTATGKTDFFGTYIIGLYPTDTASAACLRVTSSVSVTKDTNGVVLDPNGATVQVSLSLVGP